MTAVYSLSAETSLIFLEHYVTRLACSKLQCSYAEHQPTPSFSCTLSIAIEAPPSPTSSTNGAPVTPTVVLTHTSPISTQKKQAKAVAALLLCRELIDRGEFEPFAVFGQPDKFAFSSRREKRFQAVRHPVSTSPVAFAIHADKEAVVRSSSKLPQPSATTASSLPTAASSVPVSERDRAKDRMVLLSGLNAAEQLTTSDITQRLSLALQHCPIVHPYQSATHPQYTAYLLQFNSPNDAEEAVAMLDGRDDVVDGQSFTARMLDKPAEVMIDRAWYSPAEQLTRDWLRVENEAGVDVYYFYGYRCDLFDDDNSPYSLVLLCPSALPATQPLLLYPLLAASFTATNCADQKPRQFNVRYAGSYRLSVEEMAVATTWWARMAKDVGKRGDGQWHQEQRKYLILPVLRETLTATAPLQPANDEQLASDANNASAPLKPDWMLIDRCLNTADASLSPKHFDSDHRTLSSVILVTPHNGIQYLPHRLTPTLTAGSPFPVPSKVTGDQSFAAYFSAHGGEVDPASPLIEAQHIPSFGVDLTRPLVPSSSTVPVMLAPQLCRVLPVPVQLWRQLRCVPSFMYALESQLLTLSLQGACGAPIQNLSLLQAALTSRAAASHSEDNYERIEFLGDAWIKYSVSSQLSTLHPQHAAEQLSRIRATLVCNHTLSGLGQRSPLLSAIRADPFQPAKMSVAGVPSVDSGQLSAGVVADVVEAVVGAYYLEQGEEGARKVARWLGLPACEPGSEALTPSPLVPLDAAIPRIDQFFTNSLPLLEHALSYTFRNPIHLLHALTHTSALLPFNYNRLEWLGDAILDWLVTRSIYTAHPHRTPGAMTACRRAMVNRDAYALLAVHVLGVHDCVVGSAQVVDMCRLGAAAVIGRWGERGEGFEAGGVASLQSFKVLCDLLESVLGAVYVDCGMDVKEVKRVWDGIAVVEETSSGGMRLVARRRADEYAEVVHSGTATQLRL